VLAIADEIQPCDQAEVGAQKTMIERTELRFDLKPGAN
jgi:hypothetical protein